ncbi:MAG: GlsB/YeaQ/YmgE family stress response membrane protein [Proteobacteria bacterium]|nr:GlsB/YeaQ/YmgE family stress response membrane protein [Pseudomonadota bacterium]
MSLLLILTIGAACGWLVGIATQSFHPGGTAGNMAIGSAGAFVTGALGQHEALLGGLSQASLLAAVAGALVLLVVANLGWRAAARAAGRSRR